MLGSVRETNIGRMVLERAIVSPPFRVQKSRPSGSYASAIRPDIRRNHSLVGITSERFCVGANPTDARVADLLGGKFGAIDTAG
jgi:hypothetical protein